MSVAVVAIPVHAVNAAPEAAGTHFAMLLTDHAARDGFTLCAALDNATGRFVWLAYGFTGLPGQPWRDALAAVMGDDKGRDWLTGYFEFAGFGVIPARRREGIGGRLHDALFRGVPQQRVVLTVRQGNDAARAFYDQRDWVVLHDEFSTPSSYDPPGRGPYTVMGRELRAG